MLNLGETFPNFTAQSTAGTINLYDYLADKWALLLSHPSDFTPVCTTEIGRLSQLNNEFDKRNVKVLLISCDSVDDHNKWAQDVSHYCQCQVPYPIIGDQSGTIANMIGMLDKGSDKMITVRAVFVISPDKRVKAIISYPASTGRNMNEILRLIDSLQLTAKRTDVVTPVDWKVGGDLIVKPGANIEGQRVVDLPSGKDYLKFVNN
ncbi:1-Cys peroxiredoxin-like [Oppia nitens]|uniref:1-Cys peroxiredoxin-like n=1 Tax=Oppia nitens TaxID=1686743 RepID=UPI0023DC1966|nr:1-Cys peroxiredoxin-like [Oppia nitens]